MAAHRKFMPMPTNKPADLDGRVSVLETSLAAVHDDLGDVKRQMGAGFDKINATLAASGRVNWGVIFSGAMVIGALWASAINPLNKEIERAQKDGAVLAQAVVTKEEKIGNLQIEMTTMSSRLASAIETIKLIEHQGTQGSDKRLSILESELTKLNEEFGRVRLEGSPISDKRLAILELEIANLKAQHPAKVP